MKDTRPTEQRMRAQDKKQRRQAAHRARTDGVGLEGVITTVTTQLRGVAHHSVDMADLYSRARRDMDTRVKLSDMARAGNTQAAKRRRQLNNWELNTKPAGPSDAWQPDGKRRAVGKCDVDGVTKLNQSKRGY